MGHPDPAVLPVGTLHSLEWFWLSRRIFKYLITIQLCFFRRCPSVCLPVTPCSYHRILLLKFSGVITNERCDVHAKNEGQRSKVKVTKVITPLSCFWTVSALLFFEVIHQILRSHGLKNWRFESNLRLLGRSLLKNPSDLPCNFCSN